MASPGETTAGKESKPTEDGDPRSKTTVSPIPDAELSEKSVPDTTAASEEPPEDNIEGFALFAVMASITLVVFLMLLDMSIVSTAIPQITTEFRSLDDVGWYGSAYNLASAALQPLTGKMYTYFKAKWTFISFVLLFALGSVVCGAAKSSNMLIAGRAIAGMGTSGLQNGGMTIITTSVPLHKRPALLGILMGFSQLGLVMGPLVGGAITEYSTWRWCFYINIPAAAVVTLCLILCRIPERELNSKLSVLKTIMTKLDLAGFAIFAPAAIMFLLSLEFGGRRYPWKSPTVLGLLVGSVATFAVFIFWEHRQGPKAMIPLSMVKKKEVWSSMVVGMCLMGGLVFVFAFFLPIYFQAVKGASPFTSGVYVLPNILSSTFFAVFSGVLVTRFRFYIPWVVASGAICAIASGLLTTITPSTTMAKLVGFQLLLGARGAAFQMPLLAVQAILPQSEISVAMAVLVFSQTFGGAIFLTIVQTIFANSLRSLLSREFDLAKTARIIGAGANGIRDVVLGDDLAVVLDAYSVSVNRVFYVGLAASIGVFGFAWWMGWHDLQGKRPQPPGMGDEERPTPGSGEKSSA